MPDLLEAPAAPNAPAAPQTAPVGSVTQAQPLDPTAGSDAFGALDALAGLDTPTPAPDKPRAPDGKFTKANPEPEPQKQQEPPPQPERAKAPEPTKESEKPAESKETEKPIKSNELRNAYENLKKEMATLRADNEKLKKAPAPADDPEKRKLGETVAQYEKRMQEMENELRYVDYTKSNEYKEKYEKPYVDAWIQGRSDVSQLIVAEVKDPTTDEIIQPRREATPEDFDALMQARNNMEATDLATKMFGSAASEALAARREVLKRLSEKNQAIERYRKEGAERESKMASERETHQKAYFESLSKERAAAVEKHSKWFKPDEGDAEGQKILDQQFHLEERLKQGGKQLAPDDKPFTPQDYIKATAARENMATAFPLVVHKYKVLEKKLAEKEAALAEFEKSKPTSEAGGNNRTTTQTNGDTSEAAFAGRFGAR